MTDFHDSFINLDDTKQDDTKQTKVEPDIIQNNTDIISLSDIEQSYDNGKIKIFDKMNFSIPDIKGHGQFTAILGQSGCGKSTILRYISGLQKPTSGSIKINGIEQTEQDRIGMVFQQYSSLPWRTVLDNVCIPLELKGMKKSERIELGMEMIKLVGLDGQEKKYAQYPILSGGQLQRVALARNLITHEKIMLLDEPHGALDMKTKLEMDDLLSSIWRKIMEQDPTFLLVTHDVNEAVYLANEVIIMGANPGRIIERINIDLPIERNSKLKRTKEFINYTSYIEDKMLQLKKD